MDSGRGGRDPLLLGNTLHGHNREARTRDTGTTELVGHSDTGTSEIQGHWGNRTVGTRDNRDRTEGQQGG